MSRFVVASLVPRLLDIHGDAQNAQVLAVRAGWQGFDAEVVEVAAPSDADGIAPDAITIGAGFDADADEVLTALRGVETELRSWVDAGVPLLAVGLGWELLSTSVEFAPGVTTAGLALFSGRSVVSERHVGTIAVDSEWGRLVGYEYHLRDHLLGADERPLGTVAAGIGNIADAHGERADGAVRGPLIGTGLRGPVLARNPRLADDMLGRAVRRRDLTATASDAPAQRADEYAARANRIVVDHMKIGHDA